MALFLESDFPLRFFFNFEQLFYRFKNNLNCSSCSTRWSSSLVSFSASFLWDVISIRICTNARIMAILTSMAQSLFKTLESMATPCSVKTIGGFLVPPLPIGFDITDCDIKRLNSCSSNTNMKSSGNLLRFLLTACVSALVSISYISARSRSNMTLRSRIKDFLFTADERRFTQIKDNLLATDGHRRTQTKS